MTACESAQQSSSCADRLRKAKWGLILRPSGLIAGEPLAGKFIEISAPHGPLIAPEPGKIVPAEDSRGMHVVEYQPNGIVADRLDLEDGDVALAGDRLALVRGMPLDFGAGAVGAQEFGRKFECLAGVEDDREGCLVRSKPQLGRLRRTSFRCGRHLWFPLLLLLSRCDTSGSAGVLPAPPTLPLLVPQGKWRARRPRSQEPPRRALQALYCELPICRGSGSLGISRVRKNGSSKCRGTSRRGQSSSNALRRWHRSR